MDYRRRAAILATVLVLAAASVAEAAGASVSINAQRRGETIDINASAVLQADTETAWHVLTDYERYTEFIPDLRSSRVIARRGSTLTVAQSWDAVLWMLKIPVDVTYEVIESPPNRLDSHAVGGSLRALASSYLLTPAGSGVRLEYSGHIAPGYELLGPIQQIAVRRNIKRHFQALADEIERVSTAKTHQNPDFSR